MPSAWMSGCVLFSIEKFASDVMRLFSRRECQAAATLESSEPKNQQDAYDAVKEEQASEASGFPARLVLVSAKSKSN